MRNKPSTKAVVVEEGRWYALNPSTKTEAGEPWTEECCDCGLVHRINYKIENGRIWVQYALDSKLTRLARRRRKGDHDK